jgi:hypothetical protein
MSEQSQPRFPPRNTIPEVSQVTRLSRASVYDRIARGLLRVTKDGNRTFVTGAELERYLSVGESAAP